MDRILRRVGMVAALSCAVWASASAAADIDLMYLRVEQDIPPTLSNLDPVPEDLGIAGAQVGLSDNQTTGKFLGQTWTLSHVDIPRGEGLAEAARDALAQSSLLIVDASAQDLLTIADLPEAAEALLFNVAASDGALRSDACRANVLHTLPSDAMRTDALAQFLVKRRWSDLAMIRGAQAKDRAFAAAMEVSARKFGLSLNDTKDWLEDADIRRNAAQEVPVFTQSLGDYDALIVADETDDFGRYIAYNTWEARPVVGSEGLRPVAWSPVVEQWGAAQLQSRFGKANARAMRDRDYAAWAALRTVGEAVTRAGATDVASLRAYIMGPDFELAGFKGRPMTFRPWNGQLRHPIPVVTERAVVATAPLEGFLHQRNELDSLGIDAPESACTDFED